jgi:hypothetical protein
MRRNTGGLITGMGTAACQPVRENFLFLQEMLERFFFSVETNALLWFQFLFGAHERSTLIFFLHIQFRGTIKYVERGLRFSLKKTTFTTSYGTMKNQIAE